MRSIEIAFCRANEYCRMAEAYLERPPQLPEMFDSPSIQDCASLMLEDLPAIKAEVHRSSTLIRDWSFSHFHFSQKLSKIRSSSLEVLLHEQILLFSRCGYFFNDLEKFFNRGSPVQREHLVFACIKHDYERFPQDVILPRQLRKEISEETRNHPNTTVQRVLFRSSSTLAHVKKCHELAWSQDDEDRETAGYLG